MTRYLYPVPEVAGHRQVGERADFDRRVVAKALFQKPARLDVAEWVLARLPEEFFSLDELSRGLPSTQKSEVHSCLTLMVHIDMLERVVPVPNRPQYRRTASPLWRGFAAFVDAFATLEARAEGSLAVAERSPLSEPYRITNLPRRRDSRGK